MNSRPISKMKYRTSKPRKAGFYWFHDSAINSHYGMAYIAPRIVWDNEKTRNVTQGWWVQLLPGGVSLPLKDLAGYSWNGPMHPPCRYL